MRLSRILTVAVVAAVLVVTVPAFALDSGTDVKLTTTGSLAEIGKAAFQSDVAVNTRTGESLVVFTASPDTSAQYEVYGQRLTATGEPIGPRLEISDVGEDPDPFLVMPTPAVAYSATSDRWLVVYSVDDRLLGRPNDKFEIFARTVTADGTLGSKIQVSETGAVGSAADDAEFPDVAWNPDRDEFLVAWSTPVTSSVDDVIRVQRLSGIGTVLGSDTTISSTSAADGGEWPTQRPGVAYDHEAGQWLVVWYAEPTPTDSFTEQEIFGQLLDGRVGSTTQIGGDFRVSVTGPESDEDTHAGVPVDGATNPPPRPAYDSAGNRFLVAYFGNPGTGGLAHDEYEVFVQNVTPAGARDGEAIRMSEAGTDGSTASAATFPTIAFDHAAGEGVVLWDADAQTGGLVNDEREVFGQRIGANASPIGADFRISQTGPDGDASTDAFRPSVSSAGDGRYQVTFDALPAGTKLEVYGDTLRIPRAADAPPGGSGTGPGASPGGGDAPAMPAAITRDPAKLQVLRARVRRGRLDLLATMTARATGTLRVAFRAGGRTTRFTVPARSRIALNRLLPKAMRRQSTGILTITYAGNQRVRPDDVRLRAASGRALLRRTVTEIDRGRLRVAGSISRRARGVVRLRLVAIVAGEARELHFRAPIRNGRWSLDAALSPAVAAVGGQLDVQFTGYGPRRIRGEQLSKAVAP